MSVTQSQAEHCNGLRDVRVRQAWYISPIRGLQEEDRGSSREDAFFGNKLLLWKVNFSVKA